MAQVDFSNAKIVPASIWQGVAMENPTRNTNVSLFGNNSFLYDANGGNVARLAKRKITDQQKRIVILYQGTFTANGTEFYIVETLSAWRVYNISFNAGDTYLFKVRADLICQ